MVRTHDTGWHEVTALSAAVATSFSRQRNAAKQNARSIDSSFKHGSVIIVDYNNTHKAVLAGFTAYKVQALETYDSHRTVGKEDGCH
jgi:hypothetical protein